METAELREELHSLIDRGDADFLRILLDFAKELSAEDFSTYGFRISKNELIERVRLAKARINAGNFLSKEDMEEEIKKW
ncbi:hypothetical protein SAMN03080617_02230 [Algoriphagus alkaliphilus]|uniref:Uncharacterized protein n=1 Tax=Algoriphagus alkaliphilus TaxID=279824 RepID=A0A1G5Y483_9BACT|nr:hypothetical protein [Algoriphagus alkaliphilus]MBA4298763.1 hypothetical protein [Cyclobacterium sp.]SDA77493.1 hypothetical protein SAMN03080617_02230 [Algoriphagus alkaliphilus]